MVKLENIWLRRPEFGLELRIDWDNDQHQAVLLDGDDPISMRTAFREAVHLLGMEIKNGRI